MSFLKNRNVILIALAINIFLLNQDGFSYDCEEYALANYKICKSFCDGLELSKQRESCETKCFNASKSWKNDCYSEKNKKSNDGYFEKGKKF